MIRTGLLATALCLAGFSVASAQSGVAETRPAMKAELEALKLRAPRLPLPPPVDGERSVNNGRARAHYLPPAWLSGSGGGNRGERQGTGAAPGGNPPATQTGARPNEPGMTLDQTFKVRLFWIVSRTNDCEYCLGHQELKLARAGMTEDEVARLDCDWAAWDEREREAFGFTRKLTLEPHNLTDADRERLAKHFSGPELVELITTVAGYNSTNRWTDSLGLPQDESFGDAPALLDTPTAPEYQAKRTVVGVLEEPDRPALETREFVLEQLAACQNRPPLVSPVAAEAGTDGPLPAAWSAALADLPNQLERQGKTWAALQSEGELPADLKAAVLWAVAREDRAWYAAGQARKWLNGLGLDDQQVFGIDTGASFSSPAERAALEFARKLTTHPRQIVDADIEGLRGHFPDRQVAELVFVVCYGNQLDRFSEALRLPLEN